LRAVDRLVWVAGDRSQFRRNLLRRKHEIHDSRGHGGTRHAIERGSIVLSERDAALGFYGA